MRKFSRTCDVTTLGAGLPTMVIMDPGPVDFTVNDSVFIYADNRENDDDDDTWITAQVSAVGAGVCPSAPLVAVPTLSFASQGGLFVADSVRLGAPVRSFTPVTFGLTTYSGDTYLGRREGTDPWVPVAGPLQSGTGLEFVYRDALGAVTNVPTDVQQIVVRIRSGSRVLNSLGNPITDSITAWVYTRN
jgi:hypothetical protein